MDSLFAVKNKIIFVTGGSRGIGHMIASCYVKAGARVYITSRDQKRCAAVERELSAIGFCRAISGDLSKLSEIERIISELQVLESKLDVLVNNAGATWGASLEEFPQKGWDKVTSLNLKTPFFLIQKFLPMLKVGATPDDPSRIINIGSVDGSRGPIWDNYSYAASKAGLHHLSKTLVRPLADQNININNINLLVNKFDINAFRPWLDYPEEIISANGNIDIRCDFKNGQITYIDSKLDVKDFITKINQTSKLYYKKRIIRARSEKNPSRE